MGEQAETRARAVLIAMQERLAVGPYFALGVDSSATAPEIRTAFLELTKTYHPARFGYLSAELQKLANEVFLSLRAAHEVVARPARARERSDRSGMVAGGAPGTSDRSGAYPAAVPRSSDRSGAYPAAVPRAGDRGGPLPAAAPRPGPLSPTSPIPTRPPSLGLAPATSRLTPPMGVRVGGAPPPAAAQPTQPAGPPGPPRRPIIVRPAAGPPAGAPRSDLIDLTSALELLQRGQWDAARATLASLAERAPEMRRYRALLPYSRGREAQLAGRLDEARVELQDALQIDPDLQLAKTALAELFTRRK